MWIRKSSVAALSVFTMLSACAISEEQLSDQAKEVLSEKVKQEPVDATVSTLGMQMYLPEKAVVERLDDGEYKVEHQEEIYMLFLDWGREIAETNVDLEEKAVKKAPLVSEVKELDGEEVFLIVAPFEADTYEVKVGMNGKAVGAVMAAEEIKERTDLMFDMVQSVEMH